MNRSKAVPSFRAVSGTTAPARYRLRERDDSALFGFAAAPSSWKRYLYPPVTTLWSTRHDEQGTLTFEEPAREQPRYAFLGVRACELAAILVHDRVFVGPHTSIQCTLRAVAICSSRSALRVAIRGVLLHLHGHRASRTRGF